MKLSLALSHYDRHIPLFDGSVVADGVDLQVLEVGQSNPLKHGQDRHERMLQKGEFDICELSLSNYLIAKSRGMPFTAIPVFPRRLFSMSQMWVNIHSGIKSPQDLIGRRVGLSTFQTTLSVLARGDLQAEYNVPWREIDWYSSKDEAVPLKPIPGVKTRLVEPGQTVAASLQSPVLFTVARDLTQLTLYVDIDEADIGKLREGQDATFTVGAWPTRKRRCCAWHSTRGMVGATFSRN